MNSRNGRGGSSFNGNANGGNHSSKGKGVQGYNSTTNTEQLSRDIGNTSINPSQEGEWEVIGKKSKNRTGAASGNNRVQSGNGGTGRAFGNSWAPTSNNSGPRRVPGNSCVQTGYNARPRIAPGNSSAHTGNNGGAVSGSSKLPPTPRTSESAYIAPPPPTIAPPLHNGWQWAAKGSSSTSQAMNKDNFSNLPQNRSVKDYDSESDTQRDQVVDDVSDDDEFLEDSDDDLSDNYDSDASQKSHETRKKNRWFKGFFEALDELSVDEINGSARQWHCPACQKGPGAIDWYKGLQPLVTHAKTKSGRRGKLHRELARLLDEELRRVGASLVPAGEAFGKWRGLCETTNDRDIVWPPMVVVMNTLLEQDNDKWIGMGSKELLEYFSTYAAAKARHSYGPHGHRGMSLLVFESTAMGYLEAERLHKHFQEQGTDRDAWQRRRVLFYPGGKRQLYGFLADKQDIDTFNQHSHGKNQQKYEIKSYQEMVVIPMKQMDEDNQQLVWLKQKADEQEKRSKALEETFDVMSQKLRETTEENRIVRLRTKMQYEENKEEMDYQEQFFKEQMAKVQKEIEEKEQEFEIKLQQERAKAKQSDVNSGSNKVRRLRKEVIQRFIESQVKGVKEFEAEREKLTHEHEEQKVELKRKYLEEEIELEKAFDTALTKLMGKYAPSSFETPNLSSTS